MIFSSRRFFQKNERINATLLLVDLFSFIFWKKVKTPRRHFEINWSLVSSSILETFWYWKIRIIFFPSSWAAYLWSTTHVWLFWRVLLLIIRQNYLGKIKEQQKVFSGIIQAPTLKDLFCNPKLWLICLCLNAVWQKNVEGA